MRLVRLLLAALCLSAYAGTPALDGGQGMKRTLETSTARIVLKFQNKSITLKACEMKSAYCFEHDGTILKFPKRCRDSLVEFYGKDENFEFLGYSHGFVIAKPRATRSLMFIYSESFGLGKLYWDYDGGNSFVDRGPNLGVDMDAAEKYAFPLTKEAERYMCAWGSAGPTAPAHKN